MNPNPSIYISSDDIFVESYIEVYFHQPKMLHGSWIDYPRLYYWPRMLANTMMVTSDLL